MNYCHEREASNSREMKPQSEREQTEQILRPLSLLTLQSSPIVKTYQEARQQESPDDTAKEVNLSRYSKEENSQE